MSTLERPRTETAPRIRIGWALLTAVAPIVWGTTYIVTTTLLPPGHPMFAAMMRSLPAGLIALLISRQLPHGVWVLRSFVLGVLNMGAFFPLLFVAAQNLPGGVAATLGASQPIMVAFLTVGILHQRLSGLSLLWGVIGVVGVGLVVLGPGAGMNAVGVAAGLEGAASMAVGVTLAKKWGRPPGASAIAFAGWQLTAAGLMLLLPALLIDGVPTIDAKAWLGYAWLGIVGALLAYSLWFAGIRQLPVTATALLGLLSPLVAALLGAVLAGESLTPIQLAGLGSRSRQWSPANSLRNQPVFRHRKDHHDSATLNPRRHWGHRKCASRTAAHDPRFDGDRELL